MKTLLIICAALSSCAVNPQTGQRELSPQSQATLDRIAVAVAEGAIRIAEYQINEAIRAGTGK